MPAINAYTLLVMRYLAGIIPLLKEEMQQMDANMMNLHRAHHPMSSSYRLFVFEKDGWIGIQIVEEVVRNPTCQRDPSSMSDLQAVLERLVLEPGTGSRPAGTGGQRNFTVNITDR